jgi:hypothetical protein
MPLPCSRPSFCTLTFVSCPDIIKGRYRLVDRPWVALLGSVYVSWYALPIFLLRDITYAVDDILDIYTLSANPLGDSVILSPITQRLTPNAGGNVEINRKHGKHCPLRKTSRVCF